MRLTTASKPQKSTVQRTVRTVLKPARIQVVDGANVQIDADVKDEVVDLPVWLVTTTYNATSETHEFVTKAAADEFYKGFR